MPIRMVFLLSVVLCTYPDAAYSQPPQTAPGAAAPAREIEIDAIVLRLTSTAAERKDTPACLAILKNREGFAAFMEDLRQRGQVTILADPHLITLCGKPCRYLSGGQDENGVPLGIDVTAWPTAMPDGRIYLELNVSHSELVPGTEVTTPEGRLVSGRKTDAFMTSVILPPDGEKTCVIPGGSVSQETREVFTGPPVLKEIPFIRDIFCKRQTYAVQEETMCLVHVYFAKDK